MVRDGCASYLPLVPHSLFSFNLPITGMHFSPVCSYMASGFGSQFWTTFNWIFYCRRVSSHPSTQQDARKKNPKHQALRSCSALLQSQQAPCKASCWLLSLAIKFRDSFTSLCSHCFYSSCCWHQVVLTKCTIKKRDKLWNLVFLFCVSSLKTVKPTPKISVK